MIVDSTAALSEIKPAVFAALCANNIVPPTWLSSRESGDIDGDVSKFDAQELNLLKLDYNRIRLFSDDSQSLKDERVSLGAMLFVELSSSAAR